MTESMEMAIFTYIDPIKSRIHGSVNKENTMGIEKPRSGGDCHSTCSSFGQLCLDEAPGMLVFFWMEMRLEKILDA